MKNLQKYAKFVVPAGMVLLASAPAFAALDPLIGTAIDAAQADGKEALVKIFVFCGVLWAGKAVIRKTVGG